MRSPRLMLARVESGSPPVAKLTLSGTLPAPVFGEAYSATLTIGGGGDALVLSLFRGRLPLGITMTLDEIEREVVFAGTPAEAGTFDVEPRVDDEYLQWATKRARWVVEPPPLALTGTLAAATEGEAYSSGLTASGGVEPYSWDISVGTLPDGLAINSGTGVISGTPSDGEAGSFAITVRVTDSTAPPQVATSEQTLEVAPGVSVADYFDSGTYVGDGSSSPSISTPLDLSGKWFAILKPQDGTLGFRFIACDGSSVRYWNPNASAIAPASGLYTGANGSLSWTDASYNVNAKSYEYAIFKGAERFLDVIFASGTGSNTSRAHALGVVPGWIIAQRTDGASDCLSYHRAPGATGAMFLASSGNLSTSGVYWNNTAPTDALFYLGTSNSVNGGSGRTYAYVLFAHDTAADGLIRCDSHAAGSAPLSLTAAGWSPQWILCKAYANSSADNWCLASEASNPGWSGDDPYGTIVGNWITAENNVDLVSGGFEIPETNNGWNASGRTYMTVQVRRP